MVVDMNGTARRTTVNDRVKGKGFTTVYGYTNACSYVVKDICILRVGSQFGVIERAVGDIVFFVDLVPAVTTII